MLQTQHLVQRFMQMAGQAIPGKPMLATQEIQQLRLRLIGEELTELDEAYAEESLPAVADALTDLLYVVLGSFVAHGLDAEPLFMMVHENNMEKIINGHRDAGGKWIKPHNHVPPDISGEVLRQTGIAQTRQTLRAFHTKESNDD